MPAGSTKTDLCRFRHTKSRCTQVAQGEMELVAVRPVPLRECLEHYCSGHSKAPAPVERVPSNGHLETPTSSSKQESCQVSLLLGSKLRVTHPTVALLVKRCRSSESKES
ncbi:hypothetical protein NN561_008575 [Cricetulus griseus]